MRSPVMTLGSGGTGVSDSIAQMISRNDAQHHLDFIGMICILLCAPLVSC